MGTKGNQGKYQSRRAELVPGTTVKHASRARGLAKPLRGAKTKGARQGRVEESVLTID